MNNNESTYFFFKTKYPIDKNGRKMTRPFMTIAHFEHKAVYSYPYESDNTMLFPIFVLGLFTLFVGSIHRNSFQPRGREFGYIIEMVSSIYKFFASKVE